MPPHRLWISIISHVLPHRNKMFHLRLIITDSLYISLSLKIIFEQSMLIYVTSRVCLFLFLHVSLRSYHFFFFFFFFLGGGHSIEGDKPPGATRHCERLCTTHYVQVNIVRKLNTHQNSLDMFPMFTCSNSHTHTLLPSLHTWTALYQRSFSGWTTHSSLQDISSITPQCLIFRMVCGTFKRVLIDCETSIVCPGVLSLYKHNGGSEPESREWFFSFCQLGLSVDASQPVFLPIIIQMKEGVRFPSLWTEVHRRPSPFFYSHVTILS